MSEIFNEQQLLIDKLTSLMHKLQNMLGDIPVSKKLRDGLTAFKLWYEKYTLAVEQGDIEKIINTAGNVGLYGVVTAQSIAKISTLSDEIKNIGQELLSIGQNIRDISENNPATYQPLIGPMINTPGASSRLSASDVKKIEKYIYEQEKQDQRIKSALLENERRISTLAGQLNELHVLAKEEIVKITNAYSGALIEVQKKQEQINSILGHVSGRAIAGDYENSASDEKNAADKLRWASLVCMGLICIVLGYSVWETVQQDFQWQKSLFRVVLAFLLSAPAAYLARESTKHRMQQYQHLQTSLDLKAISPYIASLPEDIQHKIKSDVASKLFAGKDLSQTGTESYPINTQELLMEIVKKMELPKSSNDEKVQTKS